MQRTGVWAAGAMALLGAIGVAPAEAQEARRAARPAAAAQAQPAAPANQSVVEGVAAIVNDQVISTWDLRQRSALILLSSGIEPSAEALEQVRQQALRSLVDERLQMLEAREFEVEIAEDEVQQAFADIAAQNQTSPQAFSEQLLAAGVNPETLRAQLRADIAWRRLVGGRFGSRVRISDTQISDTINRIVANATKPQYLVSEILLPAETADERRQAMSAADRLIQELRQGAPFPLVAQQFSAAPSAAAGGDLGWLAEGELKPEVQAVVSQLAPGQLSRPIVSSGGIYLVALRDRRAGVDPQTMARADLLQITAPVAARVALQRAVGQITACDGAAAAVAEIEGAQALPLGEVRLADLTEQVRAQVGDLAAGGVSPIVDDGAQATAYVVCARSFGDLAPDRQDVEERLYQQEVAMLSQRYLRNLRREATILSPE